MELHTRKTQIEESASYGKKAKIAKDQRSIEQEQKRLNSKLQRKQDLESTSTSYKMSKGIATIMDKYFLDPLIGLIPGIGDVLPSLLVFPFIYLSLIKVRSIPLTLAIMFNTIIDILVGVIPFLGIFLDAFHRAHLKNFKLIVGFVEDDRAVINEVNKKAFGTAIMIAIVCLIIYWLIQFIKYIGSLVADFFNWLF